jgi:hypothetical protein
MTYPEDVMKAAREAAAEEFTAQNMAETGRHIRAGGYDHAVHVGIAARAILAERERCQRVAEDHDDGLDGDDEIGHGAAIARKIAEGGA